MAKLKQIIKTLETIYNECKKERQKIIDLLSISNNKILVHFEDELCVVEADIEDGEQDV